MAKARSAVDGDIAGSTDVDQLVERRVSEEVDFFGDLCPIVAEDGEIVGNQGSNSLSRVGINTVCT